MFINEPPAAILMHGGSSRTLQQLQAGPQQQRAATQRPATARRQYGSPPCLVVGAPGVRLQGPHCGPAFRGGTQQHTKRALGAYLQVACGSRCTPATRRPCKSHSHRQGAAAEQTRTKTEARLVVGGLGMRQQVHACHKAAILLEILQGLGNKALQGAA